MERQTRRLMLLFAIILAALLADSIQAQEARFRKIRVDFDVTREDRKGMLIHLRFEVIRMKGIDASVRIMFRYNDQFLVDRNKSYYTNTGYAAVFSLM